MNPLDEIRQLIDATRAETERLRRQEQELRQQQEHQVQRERAEPTLQFAGINQISDNEMNETRASFQQGIWTILQHRQEWTMRIQDDGIRHPIDIEVERAIIEAKFRDEKIRKKRMEQLEESRTMPQFRQIGPLAMIYKLYLRKGYFNHTLQAFINMGPVTTENAPEMLRRALDRANTRAETEIASTADMHLLAEQDEWWRTLLESLEAEDEMAKPIIIIQIDIMINKWQRHLMEEIEIVVMRQQLQITRAVISLIKYDQAE
ncbi:hypothetical protein ACA910_013340 [Epithemia clementina (nom. ined.)]